jgi:hypothetical protein
VAVVATIVAAELATPNGNEWSSIAVGATPGKNVAVGCLDDGEDVTGALIGHGDLVVVVRYVSLRRARLDSNMALVGRKK